MPSDHPDSITTCQGCGGRNAATNTECDWCGRPFISKRGRLRLTVWQVLSSLLLLGLIGAVAALAWLNAGRNLPPVRVAAAPTSTAVVPTVQPTPAVTPRVTTPTVPTATPLPVAAASTPPTEVPTPEPSPTPQQLAARIANTAGQGVSVRLEPGPQAPRAGVLREGTTVRLTGNDQTVAARPWREIETEDHRLKGWVSADFLQMVQTAP
jgi:hypothetical protein